MLLHFLSICSSCPSAGSIQNLASLARLGRCHGAPPHAPPEESQKQLEKALEYTRIWRVTASVEKCAVGVCNDDKANPVKFSWKWWGQDNCGS